MILEAGTDEQLRECAFQACLPRPRTRWVYYRHDDLRGLRPYRYFSVRGVRYDDVLTDSSMIDFKTELWVLLVAEGMLRPSQVGRVLTIGLQ